MPRGWAGASMVAIICALSTAASRANSASEIGCVRSPIARASCGATVLTKACTSAVSGNSRRPSLTEEKQAEVRGGEQPGIAIVAVGSPASLVGMFHGRQAIFLDQPLRNPGKQARHPVKDLYQAPWPQARLIADAPRRDAVEIVHRDRRGDELVTIETLREDGGGPRLEAPSALRTILLRQPIEHPFGLHRVAV